MSEPKKKSKKKILIIGAIAIIIIIILLNLNSNREKTIEVNIEKVKTENLRSIISASGEIKPKKNINISAHIPGRIVKIGVVEGQRVKAKDFLLKLDATQYEAMADRDRAIIRTFRAELIKAEAMAKRDAAYYNRQKKLHNEQLISGEQLESAKAGYDISNAQRDAVLFQIQQANASLQSTLDNLKKTVYNSPIDGIITSLRVEEGEIALVGTMNNPGTVLMSIADLSVMEVEVEVDETDVINVLLNQIAEVRVDAFPEKKIRGVVTEIGSSALQKQTLSQESKDFKVVITLEHPPENLKPGLSASADVITSDKQSVLAVPISSIVLKSRDDKKNDEDEEKPEEGVYTIDKDNRAQFTPVEKGILGELKVEIISGLKEDQKIVAGPYSALRILKNGSLLKEIVKKDNEKE